MSRNAKFMIASILMMSAVSFLFLQLENTGLFWILYGFTLLTIIAITIALCRFDTNKVYQSFAVVFTVCGYAVCSVMLSTIAYMMNLDPALTFGIHAILAVLGGIATVVVSIANASIAKRDYEAIMNYKAFSDVKKDYWKG